MNIRHSAVASGVAILLLNSGAGPWLAAQARRTELAGRAPGRTAVAEELDNARSELRTLIERYAEDRQSLNRVYSNRLSSTRFARMKRFYTEFRDRLAVQAFDSLSAEGRIDYVLFQNHLDYELLQLEIDAKRLAEVAALIPFGATILDLDEARRGMQPVDARRAADVLNKLKAQIGETQKRVEAGLPATGRGARGGGESAAQEPKVEPIKVKKVVANRALGAAGILRATLRNWYGFYNDYDPLFTWWVKSPYEEVDSALNGYATFLAERVLGVRLQANRPGPAGASGGAQRPGGERPAVAARAGDTSDIIGDPIGHDATRRARSPGGDRRPRASRTG